MAGDIKVVVQVDKTQLGSLQAEIEKISEKPIKLKIDSTGVKNFTQDTNNATGAVKKYSKATEEATGLTKLMGASLGEIAAKMTAWMVMGNIVASFVRSFRDAISTLKEVDSALVTVQKVTGMTGTQLDALTEKTYELAAAYGRTADELMNLSADFARAGFSDNLAQMTELAALLENVGDLEGDTASKFLLAANAAWQLGGDYESLMGIIDGMNAVTNQAAVDMEALTNGITVAGAVFANAGESAQTYTAMVGAAVASTQRSGNEIARGLRTIAMNVRQIKGELEDGEIIDEESISNAAAALHSVGISVADANGELRLTSDVLSDLAGKWDELTTAEQSYLAQSLAGKRQANILTALMQNWGEVERQMEIYANGAGSALQENEIYLDSWEAKSKQLTATWTQFISHLIETDTVKGAIDALNSVITALDSNMGRAIITIGAMTVAFVSLYKAVMAITKAVKGGAIFQAIQFALEAVAAEAATATEAIQFLTATMMKSPLFVAAVAAAAIYGAVKAFDALTTTTEEAAEAMRAAGDAYDEAMRNVDALNEKLRENIELLADASLAGKDDSYKQTLMEENQLLREQIDEQLTLAELKRQEAVENAMTVANRAVAGEQISQVAMGPAYVNPGPSAEDVQTWIEARDVLKESIDYAKQYGLALDQDLVDAYNRVNEQIDIYMDAQQEGNEAVSAVVEAYDLLYDALDELSSRGEVSAETMEALTDTFPGFTSNLRDASDNAGELANVLIGIANNLVGAESSADGTSGAFARLAVAFDQNAAPAEWLGAVLNEDVSAFDNEADAATNAAIQTEFFALKAAIANNQKINTAASISALGGLEGQSYSTAAALQALIAVFAQVGALDAGIASASSAASSNIKVLAKAGGQALLMAQSAKDNYDVYAHLVDEYNKAIDKIPTTGGGGSNTGSKTGGGGGGGGGGKKGKSGGGGGGSSSTDSVLEAHKSLVSLLEAELDLMEARGDSTEDQIGQIDKIQTALHDEAEYLRKIGGHEEDVVKLSAQWWKYEKEKVKLKEEELKMLKAELSLMKERGDRTEDQVAKMRQIQTALHEQADRLRTIQGQDEEIVKLSTEWWKYENEIRKIELEIIENRGDLLKSELNLIKERGDGNDAYIAKQREIQANLHEQAEALRQTQEYLRGDADAIAKVNALSYEWWQIEKDIRDVMADIAETEATKLVDAAEEAATGPLKEQLEVLKEQKEAISEAREEEEKLLAVEKARIALENAERERNIRQYNASTGQWEWVANAKTVESARQSLEKAERDLSDFYLDRSIEALEKNIKTIEGGYDELRSAIDDFAEEVRKGTANMMDAFESLSAKIRSSGVDSGSVAGLGDAIFAASGAFATASDTGNGRKPSKKGRSPSASKTGVTAGEKYWGTNFNQLGSIAVLGAARGLSLPTFDSGGILRGVGGIKATYGNEMVLPPSATAGLLNAEQNGSFDALLAHLGIVTSAANRIAGFGTPTTQNSIGSQHNGDTFEINGVTIGEAQAKSTTIYDFAQMAKLLSLRNGA